MGINQRAAIVMSDDEITTFIARSRIASLGTHGRDGIHLTAMWYGIIDGDIWFETKAKSQKAVNLRRDPRATVLIEAGDTYDTLRGVSLEGTVETFDDPDTCFAVGRSVWERYNGPYTDDLKPAVQAMMNNRIAARLASTRIRSWDHRKMGLPAMPVAGSTAQWMTEQWMTEQGMHG